MTIVPENEMNLYLANLACTSTVDELEKAGTIKQYPNWDGSLEVTYSYLCNTEMIMLLVEAVQ